MGEYGAVNKNVIDTKHTWSFVCCCGYEECQTSPPDSSKIEIINFASENDKSMREREREQKLEYEW